MRVFTFCLLTILFHTATSLNEDYYWKDYKGEIPSDALPAGHDENGKSTFIGQAYIHKYAVAVAQIYPGKKEVDVPCYGVKKATRNIKILCTKSPNKFSWLPTTASTFHVDTAGLHVVPGGTDEAEPNKGLLNIGRIMFQGILKIGAAAAYSADNVFLYFPHETTEHRASRFHVLVYNDSAVDYFDNAIPLTIPCVDLRSSL